MKYKLTRHDQVRFDIAAILDFVGNYAGYRIGRLKVKEIQKTLIQLPEYPHTGVKRDEIATGLRVIQSGEKADDLLLCQRSDPYVHIICITYAGQDWQRIAQERSSD